jgi:hypothetical protein
MLNVRGLLVSAALIVGVGGCSYSPLGFDAPPLTPPRFGTGQTLGSGHRNDDGSTTTTASGTTVAADSGTTSVFGGQTLGSGH